ncbi:hypothetical protein EWI07_13390 [Sporolactobacillus sp. THM7-4]|nr:hypothetical protein EWI07_13390 [Sporolactobacillus sp. THM7-4]
MEKISLSQISKKQHPVLTRTRQFVQRLERLSAEDLFETLASIMFRMILFLGIPYFLFILWSFIRMNS